MRYTWIDGVYVEISTCDMCPFFSTEFELAAKCRYPHNPSKDERPYLGGHDGVAEDCPLKKVE